MTEQPRVQRHHTVVLAAGILASVLLAAVLATGVLVLGWATAQPHRRLAATQGTAIPSVTTTALTTGSVPGIVDINTTLGDQGAEAAGTGIVLSSDGLVLTNNHVVAGSTSIKVTDVDNGQAYTGNVVGYDRGDDVAVVRLSDASGLPVAPLGDSTGVTAGQQVTAIGNAGGVGGTPSEAAGTVVAVDQSITAQDDTSGSAEQLSGLIEINAAIQPGDSGGPLVNANGQVIGIDTAGSTTGSPQLTSATDGFAIPINTATTIAKQIESGQATSSNIHLGQTAFLGIETTNQQGYSGVPILGVRSGSPADNAGLTRGDVLQSVNGQTVDSPDALTAVLDQHHPGDQLAIGFTDASGQSQTVTITAASGPVG